MAALVRRSIRQFRFRGGEFGYTCSAHIKRRRIATGKSRLRFCLRSNLSSERENVAIASIGMIRSNAIYRKRSRRSPIFLFSFIPELTRKSNPPTTSNHPTHFLLGLLSIFVSGALILIATASRYGNSSSALMLFKHLHGECVVPFVQ